MDQIAKHKPVYLVDRLMEPIRLLPHRQQARERCIQYHQERHVPAKHKPVNQVVAGQERTLMHLVRWIRAQE